MQCTISLHIRSFILSNHKLMLISLVVLLALRHYNNDSRDRNLIHIMCSREKQQKREKQTES